MNTAQTPSALDETTQALAAVLCELIREADDSYIKENPEDAFVDLAAKLILRLSRKQLTVASASQHAGAEAAKRIFDVFTTWMQMQPDRAYVTRLNETSGKFEVTTLSPNGIQAFFQGGDVQDAYAQMAQVLLFSGGKL
jgi:hypothetical protein